ncbi:hypothetical protein BDR03DRAFT_1095172 [Suillus americanus]|nr:hypothetical protein BDR03DRAFT_1095172 [Suillus americanus]
MLRNTVVVESVLNLYTLLENLSVPRFANATLQLSCIAFPLTEARRRPGQDGARYDVKADGLVEFSPERRTEQTFLLVHPWNQYDLGLINFADETQSVEGWRKLASPLDDTLGSYPGYTESATRGLRLIVHLGQPFGALLLAQQWGGEYKRIASDDSIIAQVRDMASVGDMMDVRILDILWLQRTVHFHFIRVYLDT